MSEFSRRIRKNMWNPLFLWGLVKAGIELRRYKKRRAHCEKVGHKPTVRGAMTQTASSSTVIGVMIRPTCSCANCGDQVAIG